MYKVKLIVNYCCAVKWKEANHFLCFFGKNNQAPGSDTGQWDGDCWPLAPFGYNLPDETRSDSPCMQNLSSLASVTVPAGALSGAFLLMRL